MEKSNYLDERFIEEVKNANNIVDIISKYVDLKKAGDNYKGLCPFHNEKTPSFSVNENKQIFKCFGCGEGGNAISFLMKKENISFIDSIKMLCENARIEFPTNFTNSEENMKNYEKKQRIYSLHTDIAKYYFKNLQDNIDNSKDYLINRGIDSKSIRKFGLGYENRHSGSIEYLIDLGYTMEELLESMIFREKNGNIYSIFFSRIMYPIFDYKNRVVAFGGRITGKGEPKYLNSPESIIFKKKEQLYGLNLSKKYNAKRIILVEGYMDVIRLNQQGIVGAVASLGTSLTKEQSEIIKKQNKKVYICYDSDKAGKIATLRAIEILQSTNIKPYIINLGKYKDPDEFFNENKTSIFMEKIDNAISSLSFIIDTLKDDYNLDIYSQKMEFIEKSCEKIKLSDDPIEMEYQTKRLADITKTSIKSIGTMIYGKYFSPKQFSLNENDVKNDIKQTIPIIKNKNINEAKLLEIILKKPDYMPYIMDILSIDDIDDDTYKKYYSEYSSKNKSFDKKRDEYRTIRRLALLSKIDKLQSDINDMDYKSANESNVQIINQMAKHRTRLIKSISQLKEDIKGLK